VKESAEELEALRQLLEGSWRGATEHLRSIIEDKTALTASELVRALIGMKVVTLATVTSGGEPRISALDGHFFHGTWYWSTSGSAAKARHMRARPSVSLAHVEGETLAVFAHGQAEELQAHSQTYAEVLEHLSAHYGSSPLDWGPDIRLYQLKPSFMVGYAPDKARLFGNVAAQ
jgi:general stress protein 26